MAAKNIRQYYFDYCVSSIIENDQKGLSKTPFVIDTNEDISVIEAAFKLFNNRETDFFKEDILDFLIDMEVIAFDDSPFWLGELKHVAYVYDLKWNFE